MEKNFIVDFYKEDDKKPVGEFINSLTARLKAPVVVDLKLLEEFGNLAREPLSKHLTDGIFELELL